MNTDNKLIAEAYAQKLHENKPRKIIRKDTGPSAGDAGYFGDLVNRFTVPPDNTTTNTTTNTNKPDASETETQPSAGDAGYFGDLANRFTLPPDNTTTNTNKPDASETEPQPSTGDAATDPDTPDNTTTNTNKPDASETETQPSTGDAATDPDTPDTVNSTATGATKPAFEPRDMPDNWQNASWAKRARSMGRGNRKRTQELAAKEWKRHEAMRQEREQATARGESDFVNQIKKIPGNIRGFANSFATGRKPIMTDAGDIKRDDQGKLMFEPKKQKADPVSTAAPTAASADKYHRDQFRKSLPPRERMNLRPGSRGYSQKYRQYMKTAQSPVQPESYSAFDDVLNKHGVQNLLDG